MQDHNQGINRRPPWIPKRVRRQRIILLLVVSFFLSGATIPYLVEWANRHDRSGQQLTPAQARMIVIDVNANIHDRKRALHRLNKAIQININALNTAFEDTQFAPDVTNYFKAFRRQMGDR